MPSTHSTRTPSVDDDVQAEIIAETTRLYNDRYEELKSSLLPSHWADDMLASGSTEDSSVNNIYNH